MTARMFHMNYIPADSITQCRIENRVDQSSNRDLKQASFRSARGRGTGGPRGRGTGGPRGSRGSRPEGYVTSFTLDFFLDSNRSTLDFYQFN